MSSGRFKREAKRSIKPVNITKKEVINDVKITSIVIRIVFIIKLFIDDK